MNISIQLPKTEKMLGNLDKDVLTEITKYLDLPDQLALLQINKSQYSSSKENPTPLLREWFNFRLRYPDELPSLMTFCKTGYLLLAKNADNGATKIFSPYTKKQWGDYFGCFNGELFISHGETRYHEVAFLWCCKGGHIRLAKWIYSIYGKVSWMVDGLNICAKFGRLNIFKWLFGLQNADFRLKDSFVWKYFRDASRGGHLDVVEWLWSNYFPNFGDDYLHSRAILLDIFMTSRKNGKHEIADWILTLDSHCIGDGLVRFYYPKDQGIIGRCIAASFERITYWIVIFKVKFS